MNSIKIAMPIPRMKFIKNTNGGLRCQWATIFQLEVLFFEPGGG